MRTVWHLTGKREGGWPARSACAPKIGKLVSQPHNGKVPQHGEKWCPRPSLVRGDLFKFSLHFVYAVSPDLFFFSCQRLSSFLLLFVTIPPLSPSPDSEMSTHYALFSSVEGTHNLQMNGNEAAVSLSMFVWAFYLLCVYVHLLSCTVRFGEPSLCQRHDGLLFFRLLFWVDYL